MEDIPRPSGARCYYVALSVLLPTARVARLAGPGPRGAVDALALHDLRLGPWPRGGPLGPLHLLQPPPDVIGSLRHHPEVERAVGGRTVAAPDFKSTRTL